MTRDEIVTALRCCASIDGSGCGICPSEELDGKEIYCGDALKLSAADLIENQQNHIRALLQVNDALQERHRWVPVTERLPELWRNDETAELVNYMIYSPDFGVDIGNYHASAKKWLCMALPCAVTHWMPLPEAPETLMTEQEG